MAKALTHLPDDVTAIFDRVEKKSKFTIEHELRLRYYQDFTKAAMGSTTLHFRDVEGIIRRRNADLTIGHADLYTLMISKLDQSSAASGVHSESNEYFDFEHFVALIHDLLYFKEETTMVEAHNRSFCDLARQLPLDPDSGRKRAWDLLCLTLLLYCSFSVPYSIAFDDSIKGTTGGTLDAAQAFDLAVDCVFLFDIALNFVTGWDNQGYVIRDFRTIASSYARSWLLPDFAGSFPFDMIIASFLEQDSGEAASSNLMRTLKLVRMLKLVRAVKFMNKLNKLKQQSKSP